MRTSYPIAVLMLVLVAAFSTSTAAFAEPKEKSGSREFETRPLNFTRVEAFGSPDVHWVHATVDPRDEKAFSFEPEIVEENVAP